MNIDKWYGNALKEVRIFGSREVNKRTGVECEAAPGLTFQTDLLESGFPLLSLRKLPIKNFVAEQMWFLGGEDRVQWLSQHTKIWDSFAEADGRVTSAYGKRWRRHFALPEELQKWSHGKIVSDRKLDQLEAVLEKLESDPSSRQGVVMMWDPTEDLLVPQKNVPCPYTFTLNIIGRRLHLHLVVRSNDMVLGFPTDVAGFALLQMVLAQRLGVKPGTYTHSISNAHVYANHYDAANTMVERWGETEVDPITPIRFSLPEDSYERARRLDEHWLREVVDAISPQYLPHPAISGLLISK